MGVETGKRGVLRAGFARSCSAWAAGDALSCAWRAFARLRQGPPAFATLRDLDACEAKLPASTLTVGSPFGVRRA